MADLIVLKRIRAMVSEDLRGRRLFFACALGFIILVTIFSLSFHFSSPATKAVYIVLETVISWTTFDYYELRVCMAGYEFDSRLRNQFLRAFVKTSIIVEGALIALGISPFSLELCVLLLLSLVGLLLAELKAGDDTKSFNGRFAVAPSVEKSSNASAPLE